MQYPSAARGAPGGRSSRLVSMKGTPPSGLGFAARVLSGFGALPEVGETGVHASLQGDVTLANQRLVSGVVSFGPKPLELCVRVEYERWPLEASRKPRTSRMETYDKERAPREAEREARIIGIAADRRVPLGCLVVAVVQ